MGLSKKNKISVVVCFISLVVGFSVSYGLAPAPRPKNMLDSEASFAFKQDTYLFNKDALHASPPKDRWVVLMSHGLSATYYEWNELADYLRKKDSTVLLSRVLLGGHGDNVERFRSSNWHVWQKPLLDEYQRLVDLGFKKIIVVTSSTSALLALEALTNPESPFAKFPPQEVIMVDPFYRFSKWYQEIPYWFSEFNMLPILELIAGDQGTLEGLHPMEMRYWHIDTPLTVIASLGDLADTVVNRLESNFRLPKETKIRIFSAKQDTTIDPRSGELLFRSLKAHSQSHQVEFAFIDSRYHVFTRLLWRTRIPQKKDRENQEHVFKLINKVIHSG